MAAPSTKLFIHGNISLKHYIFSRNYCLRYAVSDEKRKELAWCLFSRAMAVHRWENGFANASLGMRKLGDSISSAPKHVRAPHAWVGAEKGTATVLKIRSFGFAFAEETPAFSTHSPRVLRHTRHSAHSRLARDPQDRPGP